MATSVQKLISGDSGHPLLSHLWAFNTSNPAYNPEYSSSDGSLYLRSGNTRPRAGYLPASMLLSQIEDIEGSNVVSAMAPNAAPVYGNGVWVSIASSTDLFKSTDGVTWTAIATGLQNVDFYGVAFGGGTWVFVDVNGNIVTSADLVTFTLHTEVTGISPSNGNVYIKYAAGIWVVVAPSTAGTPSFVVTTSTDNGTSWSALQGANFWVYGIVFGNGMWLLYGDAGGILTSPDGLNWTDRTGVCGVGEILSAAYGNNVFVVVQAHAFWRSSDPVSWTQVTTDIDSFDPDPHANYGPAIKTVFFVAGHWIVSNEFRGATFSEDGITWSPRKNIWNDWDYPDVIVEFDGFLLVGGDSWGAYISIDGFSWMDLGYTPGNLQVRPFTWATDGHKAIGHVGNSKTYISVVNPPDVGIPTEELDGGAVKYVRIK